VVTENARRARRAGCAGTPLLVITDLQDSWLNVYVGGPDLPRVRIGEGATIVTDDGQSRKGRITYVASQAEFTPRNVQTKDERVKLVFRVKIGLDNSDGMYKPGMPAEARIAGAK
jgi:HlyD family secretion protein